MSSIAYPRSACVFEIMSIALDIREARAVGRRIFRRVNLLHDGAKKSAETHHPRQKYAWSRHGLRAPSCDPHDGRWRSKRIARHAIGYSRRHARAPMARYALSCVARIIEASSAATVAARGSPVRAHWAGRDPWGRPGRRACAEATGRRVPGAPMAARFREGCRVESGSWRRSRDAGDAAGAQCIAIPVPMSPGRHRADRISIWRSGIASCV